MQFLALRLSLLNTDDRWLLSLTPVLVSWGPALMCFCLWARARSRAGESVGCPSMGQTLFFSAGACGGGEAVQLAGRTCRPVFLSPGNTANMVKCFLFAT